MISHDIGTGTYKHAMLPNGHCSFSPGSPYNTAIQIAYANIFQQNPANYISNSLLHLLLQIQKRGQACSQVGNLY